MKSPAAMDPKQLGVLVNAFSGAFIETPEDADLVARIRLTLEALPDKVVRQLRDAVDILDLLTKERLQAAEPASPPKAPSPVDL
jgi:hypothetical protein